jgi:hypothetical protein
MMLPPLWPLLLPLLTGFVFVSLSWPRPALLRSQLLLKVCLAIGIGVGLFSCFFFLWLLTFGPSRRGLIEAQLAVLGSMIAILIYRVRTLRYVGPLERPDRQGSESTLRWVLLLVFVFALALVCADLITLSLRKPHGDWDAWAIWNLRARFIFRAGDLWREAFSYVMDRSRPDYPVLIPMSVAGLWTAIGVDTVFIPALLAILFTLATVGLTVSSLSLLRGGIHASLAGLILLGTPLLITHTASQYADIPLGFFLLSTVVLVAFQDDMPINTHNFMVLAGVTAGLSAWTKNEGLLFVMSIVASRFAVCVPLKGLSVYLRQMRAFATGLVPILVVVLYFKVTLAPPSYLVALQTPLDVVVKILDPSRYKLVWSAFVSDVWGFGGWAISLPVLLVCHLLLLGARIDDTVRLTVGTSALTLCLMLAGYSFIYVVTPLDIGFQLDTSLSRVLLQLWPSAVFTYFLLVRPIGTVVETGASPG